MVVVDDDVRRPESFRDCSPVALHVHELHTLREMLACWMPLLGPLDNLEQVQEPLACLAL